jgi:hypothetical protein
VFETGFRAGKVEVIAHKGRISDRIDPAQYMDASVVGRRIIDELTEWQCSIYRQNREPVLTGKTDAHPATAAS